MTPDDVRQVLDKPIARDLLLTGHLAYLGYDGLDGFPRVIPVGFIWQGGRIVVCTVPQSAKVAALRAHPRVAVTIDTEGPPPRLLMIRGPASVEIVEGVPDEYLAANRKSGDPEQWRAFEAEVRRIYDRMARISIEPDWATLIDFETTLPRAVEDAVRRKAPDRLPSGSAG